MSRQIIAPDYRRQSQGRPSAENVNRLGRLRYAWMALFKHDGAMTPWALKPNKGQHFPMASGRLAPASNIGVGKCALYCPTDSCLVELWYLTEWRYSVHYVTPEPHRAIAHRPF